MMEKYQEICDLFRYCATLGFSNLRYEPFFDGHQIIFPNGADVVQHGASYGGKENCVEFASLPIEDLDYCAIPLEKAKEIVETFFDELNETY